MIKIYRQLILLTTLCICSASLSAQTYRILISNDDGIDSPLLAALQQELAKLPNVDVVVSAPNDNQSGSSMSSIGGPTVVDRYYRDGSFFGYAVHGRPSNAVMFGLQVLGRDDAFDLVVSGINRGANVGDVSHASGTIGAAMRALYLGVPAIAISQEVEGVNTEASAKFAAQLVVRYQRQGAPEGVLISINIPAGELRGVAVRPMGDSYLQTGSFELIDESGNRQTYERERIRVPSTDESTDTYAYQQGYITLTPLKFDWTAHGLIDEVKSWDLQLVD
ncbi:MAG: 5'/3'-nucleotidase SurE [Pseudomonadales bacterium]|jgi:5'-nucleotidase|nr:5'/3'-nucleotidase SurE [Pseudomonadales bacterium]